MRHRLYELQNEMLNVGLLVESIEHGGLTRCKTTSDKGGQKSGWYRIFDDSDLVICVYGDWRTGIRHVWANSDNPRSSEQRLNMDRLIKRVKLEEEQARQSQWAINRINLKSLWHSGSDLRESNSAGKYLSNRGLQIPNSGVLKFHPSLNYWNDGEFVGEFPAMLAAVTTPQGDLVTVHRTFLNDDGHKAPVPTPKKLAPAAGSLSGASIKIGTPTARQDGTLTLGIAEGVETALAASTLFGVPVWSAVAASNLKSFAPPASVKNIYIFADNDLNQVGQKASQELGERLTHQGHVVRIHTPEQAGKDWADILVAKGASHV